MKQHQDQEKHQQEMAKEAERIRLEQAAKIIDLENKKASQEKPETDA